MTPALRLLLLITCFLTLTLTTTGCVSILNATSKGPIETDPTERSFGSMLDDKRLSTVIAVNIKKSDERLDKSNINVTSYNSIVLLTGQVPTIEMRELAGKVARDIHKVRIVHNELEVIPNIPFLQASKDKWLDTKIDTKLFASKQIDSQKIKIIVENNIVYLMGTINEEQADLITDVVRRTKGVEKVIRALEFVDSKGNDIFEAQNEIAAEKENSGFLAAPLNKTVEGEQAENPFVFEEDGTAIEDIAREQLNEVNETIPEASMDTMENQNHKEENLEAFSDL